MPRRNSNFYGDSGATFNRGAREQIQMDRLDHGNSHSFQDRRDPDELLSSYGDPQSQSEDVDTSPKDEALVRSENIPGSRTNAPVPDEYTDQAERITRNLHRQPGNEYSVTYTDPNKRREFVRGLAEKLRGGPATPATQPEEQEKPFSSNEFWNSEEPKRIMPRKL
jgi:hypothetical protein